MKRLKPQHLLIITAFIVFFASFTALGSTSIDLHLHDTYFVIATGHILWFVTLLLLALATLHTLFHRILLYQWISWLHTVITMIVTLLTILPNKYAGNRNEVTGAPRRYYDYSAHNAFGNFGDNYPVLSILMTLFILAQLLFIVSILLSSVVFIYKRVRNNR